MRKSLLSLLIVVILSMLAVVPAFAQDEPGTIADIVVASAGSETPEFTVLLAAVSAADPAILELLSNPEANLTVFAPTDAAFTAALEALGVTAEELLANTELLNEVLLYHVVPGTFDAASVVSLDGSLLGTMLPESALAIALDGETVMVNDASVAAADVMASNGIIHVIDTVLLPAMEETAEEEMMMEEPAGSIADIVVSSTEAETPEFTTLLAAVSAADPAVLETLSNGGPYTVFAPTDEAFAAALESLGVTAEDLLADTELLTQILSYHVVPGEFSAETVISAAGEEGASIATLSGDPLAISVMDGSVMVNDATVAAADVLATNGIVHVIDTVLLPPME